MTKRPHLIFIYGPPASGKLTIATKLAKLIDFSLFHNHLTFDLARSIYAVWSDEFYDYCEKLRVDAIHRAMKNGRSLIFTFCFNAPEDIPFVQSIRHIVEESGANLHFVKLEASVETLKKRVVAESRKKYGKIDSAKALETYLEEHCSRSPISSSKSLSINTTKISASDAATAIAKHFL